MTEKKGKPRTGDGYKAKGKKPSDIGHLQMRETRRGIYDVPARSQPRGWGIARVFDIFTGKQRKP